MYMYMYMCVGLLTWCIDQWVGGVATGLQEELEVTEGRLVRDKGQVLPHNVSGKQIVYPGQDVNVTIATNCIDHHSASDKGL